MKKEMIEWNGKQYGCSELLALLHIPKTSFYRKKREGHDTLAAIRLCLESKRCEYTFSGKRCTLTEIAQRYQIDRVSLYRYLNQGYDLEESVLMVLENKQTKYDPYKQKKVDICYFDYQGEKMTLTQIAQKERVSPSNLYRRVKKKNQDLALALEEIKQNQENRTQKVSYEKLENLSIDSRKVSLFRYCMEKGWNYRIIIDKVLKQNQSVEEAIANYLLYGQEDPVAFKHCYGKVLIKHLLAKYQLNASYALQLMKQEHCSLEDIVPKLCFSKQSDEYNKNEGLYLYDLYQLLVSLDDEERTQAIDLFQISPSQQEILMKNHQKIMLIQRELLYYRLDAYFDFCKQEEKKALLDQYGITKEEQVYMKEHLYDGFTLVSSKSGPVYIKKP